MSAKYVISMKTSGVFRGYFQNETLCLILSGKLPALSFEKPRPRRYTVAESMNEAYAGVLGEGMNANPVSTC